MQVFSDYWNWLIPPLPPYFQEFLRVMWEDWMGLKSNTVKKKYPKYVETTVFRREVFSIDFDFSYLEHHTFICFDVFYCIKQHPWKQEFNKVERRSIKKPTLKLSKFNGPHSFPVPEHNLTLKTKQNKQTRTKEKCHISSDATDLNWNSLTVQCNSTLTVQCNY